METRAPVTRPSCSLQGVRGPADRAEFREGLLKVLTGLAFDIVRNGEGTGHVLRVQVRQARDESTALGIARAVANSPLVKTAIFGNDPNVGRIISAVGDYLGNAGRAPGQPQGNSSDGR